MYCIHCSALCTARMSANISTCMIQYRAPLTSYFLFDWWIMLRCQLSRCQLMDIKTSSNRKWVSCENYDIFRKYNFSVTFSRPCHNGKCNKKGECVCDDCWEGETCNAYSQTQGKWWERAEEEGHGVVDCRRLERSGPGHRRKLTLCMRGSVQISLADFSVNCLRLCMA